MSTPTIKEVDSAVQEAELTMVALADMIINGKGDTKYAQLAKQQAQQLHDLSDRLGDAIVQKTPLQP